MQLNRRDNSPWPGPRPYTEEESTYYFGREIEVEEFLLKVNIQRLTVLTAESGIGKTSFLQAGFIPKMRKLYEVEGSRRNIGLILSLKNWYAYEATSPINIIFLAIQDEIEQLKGMNFKDLPVLGNHIEEILKVRKPDNITFESLCCYLDDICSITGSLILVIDQAEELLDSEANVRDIGRETEILHIIGKLFVALDYLTIIIALREDFMSRLRRLDQWVPDLKRRIYYLNPIKQDAMESIITDPAKNSDLIDPIDLLVVNRIISYFEEDRNYQGVNLLNLQALLLELYQFANKRQSNGQERISLNIDIIDNFEKELRSQNEPIASNALKRYISNIFTFPPINLKKNDLSTSDMPFYKYTFTNASSLLYTPRGRKRAIDEIELLYHAIISDLRNISSANKNYITDINFADLINMRLNDPKKFYEAVLPVEWDLMNNNESLEQNLSNNIRKQSGIARYWNAIKTIDYLIDTTISTFKYLSHHKVNIIKKIGRKHPYYELVHDGFGQALKDWSNNAINKAENTLAAVTARCGETFLWDELPSGTNLDELKQVDGRALIEGQCWLGCNLDEVEIKNAHFYNCDLRGSLFLEGSLVNCIFENCELSGAVFLGNQWSNIDIISCNAPSLLIAKMTTWKNVSITQTNLDQLTVNGLKVEHESNISDCQIWLSKLENIVSVSENSKINLNNCDLFNTILVDRSDTIFNINANDFVTKKSLNTNVVLSESILKDKIIGLVSESYQNKDG